MQNNITRSNKIHPNQVRLAYMRSRNKDMRFLMKEYKGDYLQPVEFLIQRVPIVHIHVPNFTIFTVYWSDIGKRQPDPVVCMFDIDVSVEVGSARPRSSPWLCLTKVAVWHDGVRDWRSILDRNQETKMNDKCLRLSLDRLKNTT